MEGLGVRCVSTGPVGHRRRDSRVRPRSRRDRSPRSGARSSHLGSGIALPRWLLLDREWCSPSRPPSRSRSARPTPPRRSSLSPTPSPAQPPHPDSSGPSHFRPVSTSPQIPLLPEGILLPPERTLGAAPACRRPEPHRRTRRSGRVDPASEQLRRFRRIRWVVFGIRWVIFGFRGSRGADVDLFERPVPRTTAQYPSAVCFLRMVKTT